MKPLIIVSSGLLLFGAGFLAGHYEGITITSNVATTKIETQDTVTVIPKLIQNSPLKSFPSTSSPAINSAAVQQTATKAPLPHEVFLTAEAQAQLAAQQREAGDAKIRQLEEMIQSMEENGLPAEDIKNFQVMKTDAEERLSEIPQALETNPVERTEAELEKDFIASLEQAGVSTAERDKMLEVFSSVPETMNIVEPTPPHEQH